MRFNILYIALAAALFACFVHLKNGQVQVYLFYGVAENEETEINFDRAIVIKEIMVEAGASVSKGEPLLLVERADLAVKKEDLEFDVAETTLDRSREKAKYEAELTRLDAEKAEKRIEFESEIEALKQKSQYATWLSEGLKSLPDSEQNKIDPTAQKIAALEAEMQSALRVYDVRMAKIRDARDALSEPYDLQLSKIKKQRSDLEKEGDRLTILAPSDGIVGNVRCRVGEHKSPFDVLISFYEKNPNIVVGYVQESQLVHFNKGDSLMVQSHVQQDVQYQGIISGLGYRVVEIPERLRRFPEIKTYGREVLVKIPSENRLLQNEKVQLFLNKQ